MRSIIFFFVFLWSINASAINPLLNDNLPQFNLKKANQTFDRINLQLSVQNLNLASLKNAISTLSTLTSEADQCVEDAEKRLNTLITLMKENADSSNQTTTGADKLYLSNEQKAVSSKQASCRLFSIRSKEAINAYKIAISKLKQKETLSKRASLFTLINRILAQPSDVPLAQMPLLDALSEHPIPVLWIGLTSITILIIMLLSFTVLIRAQKNRLVRHHIYWTHFRIKHALLLSVWLLSATVFSGLLIVLQEADSVSPLIRLSQWAFFYTTAVVLTVIFFKIKQIRSLFTWHLLDINFYRAALLTFISFYALSILGHTFAKTVALNGIVWQVLESCFLLTMIATGIYFIYYFCKTHRHLIVVKRHRRAIQRVTVAVFLAYAVLDCLGYYLLAMRLTLSGLSTFAILLGTILLIQGIHKSYFMLCHQPHITANIVKYFGYKKDQAFTEFLILKITAQVVVLALSVYLIVRVWGFATYILESTYTQLLYGIHLTNITLYPARMVMGVVVYCLLNLSFRALSTSISRHQQFEEEEETQVAIASIITYIGFALSVISALLIAGFNFTGLAIVAGALSVGIGLGLQSIVNNFVSGLILLIEKPIKTGDRINIDGIEGFVQNIRVRSTHIITPAYEDIIVPNSDLITKRVTNYVYSNKQCSIECTITVPKGCDIKQIRALLLKAAQTHDEVIKSGRNKPYVLLESLGDKELKFQLCCLIKDVNKKRLIQSDLNFAIDHLLREHTI